MCRTIIEAAKKGGTEIVTSTLNLVEVSKNPALKTSGSSDKISAFFENDYILLVNVDRAVARDGRGCLGRNT